MRLRQRYYRTPNGVVLNARQAQSYPHQDLRVGLPQKDPKAREQFAMLECKYGKLTRAERNAMRLMLRRHMSVEEAAVKLSCDREALIRLVLGFTDRLLAKRVRTVLKKDYLAAITPRRTDNEREKVKERQADGWPELNKLLRACQKEMRNGNGKRVIGSRGYRRAG